MSRTFSDFLILSNARDLHPPIVSKTADDIEAKRADWEAKEKNRLGRIRADIHIVGLDEPQDPSTSSAGRTLSTDAPVEDDLLRASNISDADAEVLRKKAKEKLAKRQADKKEEKEDSWWEKFGRQEQAKKKAEAEKKKLIEARKKADSEKKMLEEAREKAEAEKMKKEKEEARKKAEAQKIHKENLRKLAGVVQFGDIGKIKSQIRASIDSAVTAQDRSRLKGIVQDIKGILKQEARANQAAMSNAIQRGQAAQQRTAQQRRALAESIIGFVNQAQSVSGGGDPGSSRDGSGRGGSSGGSIGVGGGSSESAICQQLQQQLKQAYRRAVVASQNNNLSQMEIENKKALDISRRIENAGCNR